MNIKGTTKLLGVIGYPISHSFSPRMHNAAINHLGVDFAYLPFPIKPEDLAKAIAGFEAIDLKGFSVTIPHKQSIIPLLQEITPFAQLVGAVNTVYSTPQGWVGTNTDVTGFISPLQSLKRDWSEVTPIILGNGGAARAVVVGCAELGCPEIHVFGRDKDNLDHFYQNFQNKGLNARLNVHSWDNLEGMLSKGQLIVNTTPVGMHPNIDQSPLDEKLLKQVAEGAIAYDLIYNPRPTKFLREIEQQGGIIFDGLEMLVQQGAAALKIWLNQEEVPVDIMRKAIISE